MEIRVSGRLGKGQGGSQGHKHCSTVVIIKCSDCFIIVVTVLLKYLDGYL